MGLIFNSLQDGYTLSHPVQTCVVIEFWWNSDYALYRPRGNKFLKTKVHFSINVQILTSVDIGSCTYRLNPFSKFYVSGKTCKEFRHKVYITYILSFIFTRSLQKALSGSKQNFNYDQHTITELVVHSDLKMISVFLPEVFFLYIRKNIHT